MQYFKALMTILLLAVVSNASAANLTLQVQEDVWNYPFNPSPGTRTNGSVFGTPVEPGPQIFDHHDAEITALFGPDSGSPEYTSGLAPTAYDFTAVTLTFQHSTSAAIAEPAYTWELGVDDGAAFLGTTPTLYINIHGVGADLPIDLSTWTENTPFIGLSAAPGGPERNPYALDKNASASPQNVTNVLAPTSWATNVAITGYTPGVPNASVFPVEFTLDVTDPRVKTYIQEGLASGRLFFKVISNAAASQFGTADVFPRFELNGAGGPGSNPNAAIVTFTDYTEATSSVDSWEVFE